MSDGKSVERIVMLWRTLPFFHPYFCCSQRVTYITPKPGQTLALFPVVLSSVIATFAFVVKSHEEERLYHRTMVRMQLFFQTTESGSTWKIQTLVIFYGSTLTLYVCLGGAFTQF